MGTQAQSRPGSTQQSKVDKSPAAVVPPIVDDVLRTPGQPLDPAARALMEPRFGHDFGKVRVHTDAKAADSARAVNAQAYTVGRDVVFGEGQYSPETGEGQKLLAHELAHTLQQRFAPPTQDSSLAVGESTDQFEHAADRAALKALDGSGAALATPGMSESLEKTTVPTLQRQEAAAAPPAAPAVEDESNDRFLAKFDVDSRRKRPWNLDQLTRQVVQALSASPRAYIRIYGRFTPTPADPDPEGKAYGRADSVRRGLIQWVGPKKFSELRYEVARYSGSESDPDVEVWVAYRPQVISEPKTAPRERDEPTPAASLQEQPPKGAAAALAEPAKPEYEQPYPGKTMDILRAFLRTPLGEKFKELGKKELKKAWKKTTVGEKFLILVNLLTTLRIATYGIATPAGGMPPEVAIPVGILTGGRVAPYRDRVLSANQQRDLINLIISDQDTALIRPIPEKTFDLLEIDLDPDFRPKKVRPPLGEIDLDKKKRKEPD